MKGSTVIVPESRTGQSSLTITGSINVLEFPTTLVGTFMILLRLNKDIQSRNCTLVKFVKSILISPVRMTNRL